MKIKTLNRQRVMELEKAVDNGVYVAQTRLAQRHDKVTKKLIEQMKGK